MQEEFVVCVLSRGDLEALGYNKDVLSDSEMKRLASKMGDAYVENGFWIDLKLFLEHYNVPTIDEFNAHSVFEFMFQDEDYESIRNQFGYANDDIDVEELYNDGKTTWHTKTGDYCLEYKNNNVIKIKIYNVNNPNDYSETCGYEESNISYTFSEVLSSVLKQYMQDYLKI